MKSLILKGPNHAEVGSIMSKFDTKHMHLIQDPEFFKKIFAFGTDMYLKSSNDGSLEGKDNFMALMKSKLLYVLRSGCLVCSMLCELANVF